MSNLKTTFGIPSGGTIQVVRKDDATLTLPEYANNAAAISGGLAVGDFYRTSTGVVMVVYTA